MRFKSDPEALILGALTAGPLHGYGIVKALSEHSGGFFQMKEGQLYPLLHQLQDQGLIKGEWETPEGGPARKTYILLDPGREELARRMEEWQQFSGAIAGFFKLTTEGA